MTRVWVVARRELAAFFFSPIAYAVLAVFLAVTGILFMRVSFMPGHEAQLREMFRIQPIVLLFIIPMLTMRLIAEEFRSGTIESLMTAPVRDCEVILGKYLGVVLFYLIMLAGMLLYPAIMFGYGQPEFGPVFSSFIGMILLGTFFLAVGVLTSTMSKNQVVSAVLSFLILSVFTILLTLLTSELSGQWRQFFQQFDVTERFGNMCRGLIDLGDVVFFVSATCLALFIAVKVLESRRWR